MAYFLFFSIFCKLDDFKKTNMKQLFTILLLLFLSQCGFSQTISSEKGLSTLVYETPYAFITAYLPDDIEGGDRLTGSFSVLNKGFSSEQLIKSLAEIRKYTFYFSNLENQTRAMQRMVSIQPEKLVNFLPVKIGSSFIFSFEEYPGKVFSKEFKPSGDPILPVSNCISPYHVLLGSPLRLIGTFDGVASNTRVSIGNTILNVMAESPRQCIVEIPINLPITDKMEIKVAEDYIPKCSQQIFPIKMTVGYEKVFIRKGESVQVNVLITGMKGMTGNAQLVVENLQPNIVSLNGGNFQKIDITPAMTKSDAFYKMSFTVQGLTTGEFSLSVKLNIPEDFPDVMER